MLKKCNKCKKELSLVMFGKDKNRYDGHQYYCRECRSEYWKNNPNEGKLKAISYYSNGTNECYICGLSDVNILEINHIKPYCKGESGSALYNKLKIDNYPDGYDVRCSNCNWLYYLQNLPIGKIKRKIRYEFNIKNTVFQVYSNGYMKCLLCNEDNLDVLTVDHINGGGKKHRNGIGTNSIFYKWLIDNNFPDGFRILCRNCQKREYDKMRKEAFKNNG